MKSARFQTETRLRRLRIRAPERERDALGDHRHHPPEVGLHAWSIDERRPDDRHRHRSATVLPEEGLLRPHLRAGVGVVRAQGIGGFQRTFARALSVHLDRAHEDEPENARGGCLTRQTGRPQRIGALVFVLGRSLEHVGEAGGVHHRLDVPECGLPVRAGPERPHRDSAHSRGQPAGGFPRSSRSDDVVPPAEQVGANLAPHESGSAGDENLQSDPFLAEGGLGRALLRNSTRLERPSP